MKSKFKVGDKVKYKYLTCGNKYISGKGYIISVDNDCFSEYNIYIIKDILSKEKHWCLSHQIKKIMPYKKIIKSLVDKK